MCQNLSDEKLFILLFMIKNSSSHPSVTFSFDSGDCGAALSVIPRAHKLLSLHCGPHCEELQELQEMERCLQGLL